MNDEHELSSAAYVGGTFTERNEERRAKWKHFQQQVDWAVVGLGTCWGTAPWTVYDASELEAQGIPTVSVVTDEFEGLARETAAAEGRRGLNMVVVPHFLRTARRIGRHQAGRRRLSRNRQLADRSGPSGARRR